MKQKAILVIALLALVSMMIIPASAVTLTGTIGSSEWVVRSFTQAVTTGSGSFHNLAFEDIETNANLISIIKWDASPTSIDVGAPEGVSIPVIFKICNTASTPCDSIGAVIGTGALGYQRFFDISGNEIVGGYEYIVISSWNVTGLSGKKGVYIDYLDRDFYNKTAGQYSAGGLATGRACWNGGYNGVQAQCVGTSTKGYLINNDVSVSATYTATKPLGIGISGSVLKTVGSSKIYLFNGSSGEAISNDRIFSAFDTFNFSTNAETIKLGILNTAGTIVNSSVLFTVTAPTITPTPTPAPTIAPGYVRNTFVTIDGVNYNTIHGSNIMLRDVENSSWSNSTSDADGIFYIDTLPYHTINAYATYTVFANHYGDAELIGVETGISGMDYPIYMFPPGLDPGAGNINLYIPVVDRDTNFAIGSVGVQVELPTGAIIGDITGPGGDAAVFVVPNNTVIRARASKTGYGPVTESFNSGEVSPKTKTLYMQKLVVTIAPTSTIPTMGITTAITVDPRTDVKKAEDAFSKWMNILGDVTDIAIGVVIIWLMWLTVYMITGGKIIDKIMKRGRR